MSRSYVRLNEVVSFTVMLLMVVALVAGQSDAAGQDTVSPKTIMSPAIESLSTIEKRLKVDFDGEILSGEILHSEIGAAAVRISIDLANDLSHFRGEDE